MYFKNPVMVSLVLCNAYYTNGANHNDDGRQSTIDNEKLAGKIKFVANERQNYVQHTYTQLFLLLEFNFWQRKFIRSVFVVFHLLFEVVLRKYVNKLIKFTSGTAVLRLALIFGHLSLSMTLCRMSNIYRQSVNVWYGCCKRWCVYSKTVHKKMSKI